MFGFDPLISVAYVKTCRRRIPPSHRAGCNAWSMHPDGPPDTPVELRTMVYSCRQARLESSPGLERLSFPWDATIKPYEMLIPGRTRESGPRTSSPMHAASLAMMSSSWLPS